MKGNQWLLIGGLVLGAVLLMSNSANGSVVDLSPLIDTYGADKVQRLQNLQMALQAAGLTPLQMRFMLAQSLFETGLFTNVWNQTATDVRNNWAGLTDTSGNYKSYSSLTDFVNDYIGFLTKGSDPLDASDLTDFNNRLVANHYYTENPDVYLSGLNTYYNLLS